MLNNKEVTREVRRRMSALRTQNARRRIRLYTAVAVASCLVLVVALAAVLPGIVPDSSPESSGLYSATLLADSRAGIYVLIGVIGFALGVVVTLLCIKFLGKNRWRDG